MARRVPVQCARLLYPATTPEHLTLRRKRAVLFCTLVSAAPSFDVDESSAYSALALDAFFLHDVICALRHLLQRAGRELLQQQQQQQDDESDKRKKSRKESKSNKKKQQTTVIRRDYELLLEMMRSTTPTLHAQVVVDAGMGEAGTSASKTLAAVKHIAKLLVKARVLVMMPELKILLDPAPASSSAVDAFKKRSGGGFLTRGLAVEEQQQPNESLSFTFLHLASLFFETDAFSLFHCITHGIFPSPKAETVPNSSSSSKPTVRVVTAVARAVAIKQTKKPTVAAAAAASDDDDDGKQEEEEKEDAGSDMHVSDASDDDNNSSSDSDDSSRRPKPRPKPKIKRAAHKPPRGHDDDDDSVEHDEQKKQQQQQQPLDDEAQQTRRQAATTSAPSSSSSEGEDFWQALRRAFLQANPFALYPFWFDDRLKTLRLRGEPLFGCLLVQKLFCRLHGIVSSSFDGTSSSSSGGGGGEKQPDERSGGGDGGDKKKRGGFGLMKGGGGGGDPALALDADIPVLAALVEVIVHRSSASPRALQVLCAAMLPTRSARESTQRLLHLVCHGLSCPMEAAAESDIFKALAEAATSGVATSSSSSSSNDSSSSSSRGADIARIIIALHAGDSGHLFSEAWTPPSRNRNNNSNSSNRNNTTSIVHPEHQLLRFVQLLLRLSAGDSFSFYEAVQSHVQFQHQHRQHLPLGNNMAPATHRAVIERDLSFMKSVGMLLFLRDEVAEGPRRFLVSRIAHTGTIQATMPASALKALLAPAREANGKSTKALSEVLEALFGGDGSDLLDDDDDDSDDSGNELLDDDRVELLPSLSRSSPGHHSSTIKIDTEADDLLSQTEERMDVRTGGLLFRTRARLSPTALVLLHVLVSSAAGIPDVAKEQEGKGSSSHRRRREWREEFSQEATMLCGAGEKLSSLALLRRSTLSRVFAPTLISLFDRSPLRLLLSARVIPELGRRRRYFDDDSDQAHASAYLASIFALSLMQRDYDTCEIALARLAQRFSVPPPISILLTLLLRTEDVSVASGVATATRLFRLFAVDELKPLATVVISALSGRRFAAISVEHIISMVFMLGIGSEIFGGRKMEAKVEKAGQAIREALRIYLTFQSKAAQSRLTAAAVPELVLSIFDEIMESIVPDAMLIEAMELHSWFRKHVTPILSAASRNSNSSSSSNSGGGAATASTLLSLLLVILQRAMGTSKHKQLPLDIIKKVQAVVALLTDDPDADPVDRIKALCDAAGIPLPLGKISQIASVVSALRTLRSTEEFSALLSARGAQYLQDESKQHVQEAIVDFIFTQVKASRIGGGGGQAAARGGGEGDDGGGDDMVLYFKDFLAFVSKLGLSLPVAEARALFTRVDVDNSGTLDREEMVLVLENLWERLSDMVLERLRLTNISIAIAVASAAFVLAVTLSFILIGVAAFTDQANIFGAVISGMMPLCAGLFSSADSQLDKLDALTEKAQVAVADVLKLLQV